MLETDTTQRHNATLDADQVEEAIRAYVAQHCDVPVPNNAEVRVQSHRRRAKAAGVTWTTTATTPPPKVDDGDVPE